MIKNKEFFDAIRESYDKEQSCTIDEMAAMIAGVFQPDGQVIWKEDVRENGRIITFVEIDVWESATGEEIDMSGVLLKLSLDKGGKITTVSHGVEMCTLANKYIILFLGSIVGKILKN